MLVNVYINSMLAAIAAATLSSSRHQRQLLWFQLLNTLKHVSLFKEFIQQS